MSARARVTSVWRRLVTLLLLPGRIVEETLHAGVCYPWADTLVLWLDPETGDAAVHAEGDLPDRVRWLAARAPTLAGIASAVVLAVVWVLTPVTVNSPGEWLAVTLAALWGGRMTLPSDGDTATARGDAS